MNAPAAPTLIRRLKSLATGSTDADLIRRHAAGDVEAFADLVRRHGPTVWAVCRRTLRHDQDAEDAFQATFLLLSQRVETLRNPSTLSAWLFGVARRVSLKARSRKHRRSACESRHRPPPKSDWHGEMALREAQQIVDDELGRLPESQRAAVILCCLQGLTRDEAARRLGIPLGTLKSRLEAGRSRLRQGLERRGLTLTSALLAVSLAQGREAKMPALAFGESAVALAKSAARPMTGLIPVGLVCAVGLGLALLPVGGDEPLSRLATKSEAVDRFGDPLPEGAVARLGTVRFRHGDGHVRVAAFPDGERVVSCSGRTITIWQAATGKILRRWRAEPAEEATNTFGCEQHCVAVSPDGKTIATGGQDGLVRLWQADTGKQIRLLRGHQMSNQPGQPIATTSGSVWTVAFLKSGDRLVSTGADQTYRTWDVGEGTQVSGFDVLQGQYCWPSALNPEGTRLAVVLHGDDETPKRLIVWDLTTAKEIASRGLPGQPNAIAFSPDGKTIAVGPMPDPDERSAIGILDVRTARPIRWLHSDGKLPYYFAFSPSGDRLAGVNDIRGSSVGIWDAETGELVRTIDTPPGHADAPIFVGDRTLLTIGRHAMGPGGALATWDTHTGKSVAQPDGHVSPVTGLSFTGGGERLVTVSGKFDAEVRVWDWQTAQTVTRTTEPGHSPHDGFAMWLSPGGRVFAARDGEKTLTIRRSADGGLIRRIPATKKLGHWECHGAFDPTGRHFICDGTGALLRYDLDSDAEPTAIVRDVPVINDLAVSPDGRLLAAAVGDAQRPLRVWDLKTLRELRFPNPDANVVPLQRVGVKVVFSPDGRMLALSSADGLGRHDPAPIEIWEVASRQVRCRVESEGTATALALSPGGRLLALGYADDNYRNAPEMMRVTQSASAAVRVWDLATGREVGQLRGHVGGVTALAFSPDGRHLASGGTDTTALIWDLARFRNDDPGPTEKLSATRLDGLWETLASGDAEAAFRAINLLANDPDRSVPFLRDKLGDKPAFDREKVAEDIERLASESFAVREAATRRLAALGPAVASDLKAAHKTTESEEAKRRLERLTSALRPHELRELRAAEVLDLFAGG